MRGHIPGAWYALRAQFTTSALDKIRAAVPHAFRFVLTCLSDALARHAYAEFVSVISKTGGEVFVFDGGTNAWVAGGLPFAIDAQLASPALDCYCRPYEGTDNSLQAMQAYLDWDFGLVEQLERDGTHHFRVI